MSVVVSAPAPDDDESGMDSLAWSKHYFVFSISRLNLQHMLRFSHEQIRSLTDEDLQRIAEMVRQSYDYLETDFGETVSFITAAFLMGKHKHDQTGGQDV
jgi:hypothetical protein